MLKCLYMTSLYLSSLKLSVISHSFGTRLFLTVSLCVGVREDDRLLDISDVVDEDVLASRFCGWDGGIVASSNARSRVDRLG